MFYLSYRKYNFVSNLEIAFEKMGWSRNTCDTCQIFIFSLPMDSTIADVIPFFLEVVKFIFLMFKHVNLLRCQTSYFCDCNGGSKCFNTYGCYRVFPRCFSMGIRQNSYDSCQTLSRFLSMVLTVADIYLLQFLLAFFVWRGLLIKIHLTAVKFLTNLTVLVKIH